jgi:hypothetical protein
MRCRNFWTRARSRRPDDKNISPARRRRPPLRQPDQGFVWRQQARKTLWPARLSVGVARGETRPDLCAASRVLRRRNDRDRRRLSPLRGVHARRLRQMESASRKRQSRNDDPEGKVKSRVVINPRRLQGSYEAASHAETRRFGKLIRTCRGTANKPPTKPTKKAKEIPGQKY